MLDRLTGHGVNHRQSISKNGLIAEMRKARVLAYPCDPVNFTEGFSVTTLEAASLGCLPVIVGADALQEVYGDYVPTVKAPYTVNKYEYADMLERALLDDKWYDAQREKALQLREVFCWDRTTPKFLDALKVVSESTRQTQ
jgi:glycosyltransferase involved in cell wall biosynthesis